MTSLIALETSINFTFVYLYVEKREPSWEAHIHMLRIYSKMEKSSKPNASVFLWLVR